MRSIPARSLLALIPFALLAGCSSSSNDSSGGAMAEYPGGGGSGGGGGATSSGGSSSTGTGAGQLTAGDWDDNLNFEFFQSYLSSTQTGQNERLQSGDRVVIRVHTPTGAPISNALVKVSASGQALVEAPTASDGRFLFFPAHDGADGATSFSVDVLPPGASAFTTLSFSTDEGGDWDVELAGAEEAKPTGLDLAFVMDATGSMGDEIEYLKAEVDDIATGVAQRFPTVSVRFALVVYRDSGDAYVTRSFDFSNLADFKTHLAPQSADGGGDYEEAMDTALETMNGFEWRSDNTARVAFLVADAPPHPTAGSSLLAQVEAARLRGIKLYPVAASGTDDRTELLMRQTAQWTLGRYLFITDDSGIGGAHAEPHIPCYEVSHLNTLMKRVLYSELQGQFVKYETTDVIRSVGDPKDGVCSTEDQTQYFLY